ncbi:MAG TPA: histidine phosphatase family protein [Frankiaceae bacterium]|nr:histidine phosphatase family protein [Frankiaceae bacterium]
MSGPSSPSSDAGRTTIVHLVRHGEVFNPEGVLYGRLPGFRLSETGEQQAMVTCGWLSDPRAGRDVAAVIASPLERARQTAAPFAAQLGLEVGIDHRLIESENKFEGGVVEVGPKILAHPHLWKHLRNPFRPSWGEDYDKVAARVLAAVADAAAAGAGREVVLVSHQLPIYIVRRSMERRPLWHRPDRRQCALASVTSLVFTEPDPADGAGTRRLQRVEYVQPNGTGKTAQGSVGA